MNDAPLTILFYVSGHGFGHARRMTQVIRAIAARRPDVAIHVRSAAPARVFEPVPIEKVQNSPIDAGMIEANTLAIDSRATLVHLEHFMQRAGAIIAQECQTVRQLRPSLIVADIPFLAGDVAAAAGVPCVGISNFTWDWIYGKIFADEPRYQPIHARIIDSYSKFGELLRLPFGQICSAIKLTKDVALIAPRTQRSSAEILEQVGIAPSDNRPRILFATRGGASTDAIVAAARESPDYLFLCVQDLPPGSSQNLRTLHLSRGLDFSDVLSVCNVVVSKLGYGIVAECIAAKVRLVWPRRVGFAEDAITELELPKYVPALEISLSDYTHGRWGASLRAALDQPMPENLMTIDGADQCADEILGRLR